MSLFSKEWAYSLRCELPTPSNYYHAEFWFEWLACMHACMHTLLFSSVKKCASSSFICCMQKLYQHALCRFLFVSKSQQNMPKVHGTIYLFLSLFHPFRCLFTFYFILSIFGAVVFSGGHWPGRLQVSDTAMLPTQVGTEGSLHASGPGAQCGPRLASKTNNHHWSQTPPRKRLHLSIHNQFLAPPRPHNLI